MKILKSKLEQIEHSYFCYEKDCPVCMGVNYYLQKKYKPFKASQKQSVTPGEIWKITTEKIYPVYVLVMKNYGFYKECVRISEFKEFKGSGDVIIGEWLAECWNRFNVLNFRFERLIEQLDKKDFLKVKNKSMENLSNDLIIELFRDAELKYQKEAFLLKDEKEFLKVKKREIKIIDKIKEKIRDTFEIYPQEQPALVLGLDKNITQILRDKIFKKKNNNIYKADNIKLTANITNDNVEIEIDQDFQLLPEKIIILQNKKEIKYKIKINENKIVIIFPHKNGEYELILKYIEDKEIIFNIFIN